MKYVLVPSYQSIFLYLFSKISHPEEIVTPIVGTDNLEKLVNELGFSSLRFPIEMTGVLRNPAKMWSSCRKLVHFINTLESDSALIFGFNAFDLFGLFLVKEWRVRKREVFFIDLDPPRSVFQLPLFRVPDREFWKVAGILILFRMMGNLKHLKILGAHRMIPGIDAKFLKFYGIKPLPDVSSTFMPERLKVMKHFQLSLPERGPLYVADHSQMVVNNIEVEGLLKILHDLSSTLWIKLHPRESRQNFYPTKRMVPDYLPAELVMGEAPVVLSICSAAILQAAMLPGKLTISLLELVRWTDPGAKAELRKFLNAGDPDMNIQYPTTCEELCELLQSRQI